MTSVDRPSIDESRTYDDRGQVKTIANGAVGTATYAYDANGNKLSESWSGAMASWNFTTQAGGNDGYDAEDRFLNFNQSGQSKTLAMTRSDIGNISNVNLNGTSTARSYSNAHELTTVGTDSQSFDDDGNLTIAANGNTFGWDEAGMMQQANVAVEQASSTATRLTANESGRRLPMVAASPKQFMFTPVPTASPSTPRELLLRPAVTSTLTLVGSTRW